MEFKVPKRHIIRLTLFTDMVPWVLLWERQKRCYGRKRQGSMVEIHCYNKILIIYFLKKKPSPLWEVKTSEHKRMVKLGVLFLFKIVLFGHILKQSTHSLFGAWSFLLIRIHVTPSVGPKGFVNWFSRNRTMERGNLPWSDFMVHGVNQPFTTLVIWLWNNALYCSIHCFVWEFLT